MSTNKPYFKIFCQGLLKELSKFKRPCCLYSFIVLNKKAVKCVMSAMNQIKSAIRQMISISEMEMEGLLASCYLKLYQPRQYLSLQGEVSNHIFFINKGITRSTIVDHAGQEHTIHFALENQFIADYSSFLQQKPAANSLQAIEPTEVVVMPRSSIEWGYLNLAQGDKMGRVIAEFYFIYFDNRLKNNYAYSATERYATISAVFPDIHNRVPQHMIASYLGISPVHLSRLKKHSTEKSKQMLTNLA